MLKRTLTVIATVLGVILTIDVGIYLFSGHRWINETLNNAGLLSSIRSLPWWVKAIIIVALIWLIIRYDKIYKFLHKNSG